MKNINPQKLGKCFIYTSAILAIVAVFFMFGRAIRWTDPGAIGVYNPSMFDAAFGMHNVYRKSGMTTLFVFECISIVCLGYVLVTGLLDKNIELLDNILIIISSICSIVLIILAFRSRAIIGNSLSHYATREAILGFGAIIFGICHSLSLILNLVGSYFKYFFKVKE